MKSYKNNIEGLPEEIRSLILSSDFYEKIKSIGEKYNLHIDQTGELERETRMILAGLSRSKDFVDRIIFKLEIEKGQAEEIATEINTQIFQSIRSALQKVQEETEPDLDAMPEPPLEPEIDRGSMNRADILNGIENPQTTSTRPINVLEQSGSNQHANGDDMVDRMLTGTVTQPIVTETRAGNPSAPTPAPTTAPNPIKKYSADPYREPIN